MDATIAILTDFGLEDPYVGIMKGVILRSLKRNVHLIDLTHDIEPHSIVSASYVLYSSWRYFPENTVFLAVVDPGVGSARGELVGCRDNKVLISPDNGTVSLLWRMADGFMTYKINPSIRKGIEAEEGISSHTFHGRDILAPLAAAAVRYGVERVRGEAIKPVLITGITPCRKNRRPGNCKNFKVDKIEGIVMHIDHFGNLISSIHLSDMQTDHEPIENNIDSIHVLLSGSAPLVFHKISRFYSQVEKGEPLLYWGSTDFLEMGVREGSAAKQWKVSIRDAFAVEIYFIRKDRR